MTLSANLNHRPTVAISSTVAGFLAVLLASAGWATSGLFVKYVAGQTTASPIALAFWRDLLTFLTLPVGVGVVQPVSLRIHRRDFAFGGKGRMRGRVSRLFGSLALPPVQLFVEQPWTSSTGLWLGFAGWIAQTVFAFGLCLFGLRRLPAGIASLLSMSEFAFVVFFARI